MGKYAAVICLALAACVAVAVADSWVAELKFDAVDLASGEDTKFVSTNKVTYTYNDGTKKEWPGKSDGDFKFYHPDKDCSEDCMEDCEEDCEDDAKDGKPCADDKCKKKCEDKCRSPSVQIKTILRTGDKDESEDKKVFGVVSDSAGKKLKCDAAAGSAYDCAAGDAAGDEYMATNIRGMTIVPIVADTAGFKNFAFTTINGGARPSAVYLTELHTTLEDHDLMLNNNDGAEKTMELDVSGIDGIASPGKPSQTPWCSVLIPEGSTDIADGYFSSTEKSSKSPYSWGWNTEMRAHYDGKVEMFKRYSMGRLAWTGMQCAPDMKTCVGGGDGVMIMFVADDSQDLSEGRLFYATWSKGAFKWKEFVTRYSVDGETEDTAKITCSAAKCADAKGSKMKEADIKEKLSVKFADMFVVGAVPDADGKCADGFSLVKANGNNVAADECLKVHADYDSEKGKATIARLETYRMAAMMGAATDLDFLSGIASSIDDDWSDDDDSMEGLWFVSFKKHDSANDAFSVNACGCVYRLLRGSFKEADLDDDGELQWDDGDLEKSKVTTWAPSKVEKIACGKANSDNTECAASGPAYPMDVAWSQYHNTLFIGEAAGAPGITNARVWAWEVPYTRDVKAEPSTYGELKAIALAPKGASAQGLFWHQNLVYNALSYLTVSFGMPMPTGTDSTSADKRGYQTFLGPFPMQGFISSSSDILPNLGCPRWEEKSYMYKKYVSNQEE